MGDKPKRINPYKRYLFAPIPNWLIKQKKITQGAKVCYGCLVKISNKKGYCWPSLEVIGEEIGVGARQAKRYISELKKVKLIDAEKRGFDKSNNYFFLEHPWMNEDQDTLEEEQADVPTSGHIRPHEKDTYDPARGRKRPPELDSSELDSVNKKKAAAPRASKNGKPTNPNIHPFRDWFATEYKERLGKDLFIPSYHYRLIAELLKQKSIDEVKEAARKMLTDKWWREHSDCDIVTLHKHFNKFRRGDASNDELEPGDPGYDGLPLL